MAAEPNTILPHRVQLRRTKAVYKYALPLPNGGRDPDPIPREHTIVHVGVQEDFYGLMLWAEVGITEGGSPVAEMAPSPYEAYGTGWVVPDGSTHIGSVIDGHYVWHVYRSATLPAQVPA